jgi:Flp pilus assembly pilin Flp
MVILVRRFLRNKRGVTPVLSNVLLTVVAVAAMSLAASATYVITENMHQIMGERVIVEDVWFTSDGTSIYLRNIGKVSVEVSSVYVDFTNQPFMPLMLEVGEHGWLNVTFSWDAGSLYHINVVTNRGTKIGDYYRAPSQV